MSSTFKASAVHAVVLTSALIGLSGVAVPVASQTLDGASLEELERTYWRCDHDATAGLLDGGSAMLCSVVTETFKARRFGGDFRAMLAWWRANKDAQHQALAAAALERLARSAPRP
jgi:hypothetical protein